MNIEKLKNQIPDFAKDIKLNLGSVLSAEGAPDLTPTQIALIALSSAYTTKQSEVINQISSATSEQLTENDQHAVKSAVTIMAMNNIYYRFVHLVSDKSFASMPAKLRMNVLANPGIAKPDFELCSLAVSAINGCGMCIDAHTHELIKTGISKLAIQSCIRIAAVVQATAMALDITLQPSRQNQLEHHL
jgi:alkyl hydroperoxide reductase subunit D